MRPQTWYALYRLQEWGRWGRDKGIGFPSFCHYLAERSAPQHDPSYIPPHVEQVDQIIIKIEPAEIKQTLIFNFARTGQSKREKARLMGVPWETYRHRLDRGVWIVKTELEASPNLS